MRRVRRKAKRDHLDPQKARVYRFEDDWGGWCRNQLTLAQCRDLVRSACDHYGVAAPAVVQHNTRAYSFSYPTRNVISFQGVGPNNRGGKNAATALHEASHHICYHLFGERIADHGPTFCGVYLHLLTLAGVAPRAALEGQLRFRKVRWRVVTPRSLARSR